MKRRLVNWLLLRLEMWPLIVNYGLYKWDSCELQVWEVWKRGSSGLHIPYPFLGQCPLPRFFPSSVNKNLEKSRLICMIWCKLIFRPVTRGVRRVRCTSPNLAKGPLLGTKWAKNGVFVGGLRGEVQKSPLLGVLHLPRFNPGYGPACIFMYRYLYMFLYVNRTEKEQHLLILISF